MNLLAHWICADPRDDARVSDQHVIKAEIEVPLPRPRVAEMTTSHEFLKLKRQLHELIREESFKAMGGELKEGMGGFGMEVGPQGVSELV